MTLLLQYTLISASVLTVVAIGGMFTERSGVINLALEGCMVIGALVGALLLRFLPESLGGGLIVILSMLGAILGGMIYSLLLAVASVTFKADQTITGTAMNILSTAIATVLVKTLTLKLDGKATPYLYYIKGHDYFIVNIGKFEFNWFMLIMILVVAIAWFILNKTAFGLRLMSCGEFPQASASMGINVIKMRYIGVLISGGLAGIGGFAYINSANSSWSFAVGVAGAGFLALALMIFGKWKPINIVLGSLLFGFFRTLNYISSSFEFLRNLNIRGEIYSMIPYLVCLIVLGFTSKNSRAPKSEGIPYDPGMR